LEKEFSKLLVADDGSSKAEILGKLSQGAKTPVTLNLDGKEQQVFIEADPKSRSIQLYKNDNPDVKVMTEKAKSKSLTSVLDRTKPVQNADKAKSRVSKLSQ
jgi:hypothetical protein